MKKSILRMGLLAAGLLAATVSVPCYPAGAAPVHHAARPLTLYIVRHAEKVNDRDDSPLTAGGEAHARGLGILLENQGITRIFTSNLKRAKDTARPLADRLRARGHRFTWVTLTTDDPKVIERTLERIPDGNAVILVGRSNFVPELVQDLSGRNVQAERSQYYHLYRLVRQPGRRYSFAFEPAPPWKAAPVPSPRHRQNRQEPRQ